MRLAKKVLLIGWDAADWKFIHPLLDAGELPHLARLVEGGTIGNLATLQPCLSPMLWTSIATGKTADKHGILGFVEPHPDGDGLRLATSTSRTTKALWNILSQNELRCLVVGWFASHPAEPIRGVCVSNRTMEDPPWDRSQPWPLPPGAVSPDALANRIARLRMHPAELQREEMSAFIDDLPSIDLSRDSRPLELSKALAHTASVHNIATSLMESEPWDFCAVYYDALDVVGHDFMPFHPPRLPHVSEHDFQCYQRVMTMLYQFHDQMLGRLLELAGEETTVVLVSDHGFHSDHLRPQSWHEGHTPESQAVAWHRPYGIVVLHGNHVLRDERVYGANLLDVAPTVLRLLGIPSGQDMDGRVLDDVFEPTVDPLPTIASWDQVPADEFQHPADLRQDPYVSRAALQQLADLGYLVPVAEESQRAVEIAQAESQFNLAVVHQHHGRLDKARAILTRLHHDYPDNPRYATKLARVQYDLGLVDDAGSIVDQLEAQGIRTFDGDLVWIAGRMHQGRRDEALARIRDAERRYPPSATVQYLLGTLLVKEARWADAQRVFDRGVELDADHAPCHCGRAESLRMQQDYQEAAESALRAVGLLFHYPQAHYQLARALVELGEISRAIQALEIAVAQSPGFLDAHRELARLYDQAGQPFRALRHQRRADGLPEI